MEVFEREESRHTQVPGIGVIEDVHVKIVLGAGARWPSCSSLNCACTFTGNPHLHVSIADSLFGSKQVRHD